MQLNACACSGDPRKYNPRGLSSLSADDWVEFYTGTSNEPGFMMPMPDPAPVAADSGSTSWDWSAIGKSATELLKAGANYAVQAKAIDAQADLTKQKQQLQYQQAAQQTAYQYRYPLTAGAAKTVTSGMMNDLMPILLIGGASLVAVVLLRK